MIKIIKTKVINAHIKLAGTHANKYHKSSGIKVNK
jgi:hypothetical protein